MQREDILTPQPAERPRRLAASRDDILLKIAASALAGVTKGRMRITMPSGQSVFVGTSGTGVEAGITIKSMRTLWRSMRRGGLGFAESYMLGDVDIDDLGHLVRFYLDNYEDLVAASRGLFEVRVIDKIAHRLRRNTRRGSRRNIAAHYDLGNAFYTQWLDESMTYSSALYAPGAETLPAAQAEKYRRILSALKLDAGHRLLEIGCGWGGLAEAAGRAGAKVKAITVSNEQRDYAAKRIHRAGLGERVSVEFQDYRDVDGRFDRIASIEMIEAVGEDNWRRYFRQIADRLEPGGVAVLQAITIREEDFALYRSRPDFIQRYIFPGGMLPTIARMGERAADAGLGFETVERFGKSYAKTLADWRDRFEHAWPRIAPLGFDERFRRMWNYYFTYCEVGFETAVIDVGIYRLTKPL